MFIENTNREYGGKGGMHVPLSSITNSIDLFVWPLFWQ